MEKCYVDGIRTSSIASKPFSEVFNFVIDYDYPCDYRALLQDVSRRYRLPRNVSTAILNWFVRSRVLSTQPVGNGIPLRSHFKMLDLSPQTRQCIDGQCEHGKHGRAIVDA